MYMGRIYNVSRVHGDGRTGLVACGTEEGAGAAGPERVGLALRRKRFGLEPQDQHLDGEGVQVSTPGGTGNRVNTSIGMVSESAPRMETEVESTPRRGWCPSQHLGWKRKSS